MHRNRTIGGRAGRTDHLPGSGRCRTNKVDHTDLQFHQQVFALRNGIAQITENMNLLSDVHKHTGKTGILTNGSMLLLSILIVCNDQIQNIFCLRPRFTGAQR